MLEGARHFRSATIQRWTDETSASPHFPSEGRYLGVTCVFIQLLSDRRCIKLFILAEYQDLPLSNSNLTLITRLGIKLLFACLPTTGILHYWLCMTQLQKDKWRVFR